MSNKKKIHLVLALILLLQIILPMLTVIYENCFTIKTTAASEQSASEQKTTVDGTTWIYEIENGKAINVRPEIIYEGKVTIPSKLGNYTVTSIGEEAFLGYHSLTTIEIPSGVTSIGNQAFYSCVNLESISVAEENQNYSSKDGVLFDKNKTEIIQYPVGKKDKEYLIPSGVISIGDGAFAFSKSLINIKIPSDVTSIGNVAFTGCTSLTSIEISSDVTSIGISVFSYCAALESINVAEENRDYSSKDGVLFNNLKNNKTCLVAYPAGKKDKEYLIPEGTETIQAEAFKGCSNLTSIKIPEGVTFIFYDTFARCTSLTSIELPEGLKSIADGAFYNCDNLTIICHEASYAKEYAISNNIPYVVYGNVSGDGKIGIMDILAINKHRLGKSELTGVYLKAADVNGDGKVDLFDILQINKYRLGKIESL